MAERSMEDGFEKVESHLPVLITVIKELNTPRYPFVNGIMDVCVVHEDRIMVWNAADIGAKAENIGLDGSATMVTKTFSPDLKRAGMKLTGETKEIVDQLIKELRSKNLV